MVRHPQTKVLGTLFAACLVTVSIFSTVSANPAGAATTVTAVGSLVSAHGTALTTLAVSPKNTGDVMVVGIMGQTRTVSSISGGGATTWKKAAQFQGAEGNDVEIWYGTVTSTGASTITSTWSGTLSNGIEYSAQEFTAGLGATTVWAADKTGTLNGASSTSVPFPSLTPSGTGELYAGFSVVANTASTGSNSGFTYDVTSDSNSFVYDTNVSGTVVPVATQSPAGTSSAVGLLLKASLGSSTSPTVTGVSPSTGPVAGSTSVTLTGTKFTGATIVKFGTVAGSGLVVNSATSITIVSPPESAGTVNVTVTTPQGMSAANAPADSFTFVVTVQIISKANVHHTQAGFTVTFDFTFTTQAALGNPFIGPGIAPGGGVTNGTVTAFLCVVNGDSTFKTDGSLCEDGGFQPGTTIDYWDTVQTAMLSPTLQEPFLTSDTMCVRYALASVPSQLYVQCGTAMVSVDQ